MGVRQTRGLTIHGREVPQNSLNHGIVILWYVLWREVLWDIESHGKVILWYVR